MKKLTKVPLLQDEDFYLTEIGPITTYLGEISGDPAKLFGTNAEERAKIAAWTSRMNTTFSGISVK